MSAQTLIQVFIFVHAGAALSMTGLIWFVQIVHYPLLREVGESEFPTYHKGHSRLTGRVVGPLMVLEMATAISIVLLFRSDIIAYIGLGVLAVIWWSTFFLQVPQHRRLADGFDHRSHARLLRTNWIRTAGWSLRAGVSLVMIWTLG